VNFPWLPSFLRPLQRAAARQEQVDRDTRLMALYHSPLCTHCLRVRRAIWRLSLRIELRSIIENPHWGHELRLQGGKRQVPCLRISHPDHTEWLYESDDIVSFLKVRFSR